MPKTPSLGDLIRALTIPMESTGATPKHIHDNIDKAYDRLEWSLVEETLHDHAPMLRLCVLERVHHFLTCHNIINYPSPRNEGGLLRRNDIIQQALQSTDDHFVHYLYGYIA